LTGAAAGSPALAMTALVVPLAVVLTPWSVIVVVTVNVPTAA
jgi:hypothetical protein